MAERTTIVIFGATGDLAQRKLLPGLFELKCKGRLPENMQIVAFARTDYPVDEFCDRLWKGMEDLGGMSLRHDEWDGFAQDLTYVRGDVTVAEDLARLKQKLESLEAGFQGANRLFYLSVAPQLYQPAVEQLGASGLASDDTGWRRVVVEKPFGWDLASASELNRVVHDVFREYQVFRIDHYLGKETVQNIQVFRFSNAIFEPMWNRNYIDNVQITVAESVSLGGRAGYYDRSGVIRDMVQNHLLQLLTLVAMEPPNVLDPESLRDNKVNVLKSIRRWTPEEMPKHSVSGQYEGYLGESGIPEGSKTPTYAALRLYVDNWRWDGVPFYLRTGKAMAEKTSEIAIEFKHPPQVGMTIGERKDFTSNVLGLCLQPDEGVRLRFQVKVPDQEVSMQPVNMEFHYESAFADQPIPEAYERLLEDALAGDARLFIRSDHIEEAWKIVDPLLESWEGPEAAAPHLYAPGSWGPQAAGALMAQDGHGWLRVCGAHEEKDA
jgi:glucose-6-phosphate 1-dehydrogenase